MSSLVLLAFVSPAPLAQRHEVRAHQVPRPFPLIVAGPTKVSERGGSAFVLVKDQLVQAMP